MWLAFALCLVWCGKTASQAARSASPAGDDHDFSPAEHVPQPSNGGAPCTANYVSFLPPGPEAPSSLPEQVMVYGLSLILLQPENGIDSQILASGVSNCEAFQKPTGELVDNASAWHARVAKALHDIKVGRPKFYNHNQRVYSLERRLSEWRKGRRQWLVLPTPPEFREYLGFVFFHHDASREVITCAHPALPLLMLLVNETNQCCILSDDGVTVLPKGLVAVGGEKNLSKVLSSVSGFNVGEDKRRMFMNHCLVPKSETEGCESFSNMLSV